MSIPLVREGMQEQQEFQKKMKRIVTAKRKVEIKLKDHDEKVVHEVVELVSAEGLFYTVIIEGIKEIYKYPSQNVSWIKETLTD